MSSRNLPLPRDTQPNPLISAGIILHINKVLTTVTECLPSPSLQIMTPLIWVVIFAFCLGPGDSKTMDEAMQEFVEVLDKIGTGRCVPREFLGYLNDAKECKRSKEFSPTSHYCDDLENLMQCYDHVETCLTDENLKKFKGAALELSVQTIGMFSDEVEDALQDCPIYIELVGLRNSKMLGYVGTAVGLVIVAAIVVFFIWRRRRRSTGYSYNQTATELKSCREDV